MTYSELESSRARGRPAELYYFRYGSDPAAFFAYTDVEAPITYDGVVYNPIPIKRGGVVSQGSLDKTRLSVKVPLSSEIAELFRVYPPGQVVTLRIRGGHLTDEDSEFPVVWVGRVLQCSRDNANGPEGDLSCEPSSTSMRRVGLRRHYQLSCPHVLYATGDNLCNADKLAATTSVVVSAVSYTGVRLPDGWFGSIDSKKYVGGLLTWQTATIREQRTILRVPTPTTLVLAGPTIGLLAGATVEVILGCNHQTDDCQTLHDNILNYGGQPTIPLKNPIRTNPFTT